MLPDKFLNDIRYISRADFDFKTSKVGDVGHDLHVDVYGMKWTWIDRLFTKFTGERVVVIMPFSNRALASGIYLALPDDVWAKIAARSSASKKGLSMAGGIIDSGYRGEMYAVMHNGGLIPRIIRHGERYAQVIFHPAVRPSFAEVEWFGDVTSRGETGFGSSGK